MELFLLYPSIILIGLVEPVPLSLISAQKAELPFCEHTWGHRSGEHEVGGAAAERVGLVVAAVDIDAVKSERLQMGDHSPLLAIHLGLKEGIFHLALLRVRGVGEVLGPGGVPAPRGQGGVGDSEHVPALSVGPEEQTQVEKRALEKKSTSPENCAKHPSKTGNS